MKIEKKAIAEINRAAYNPRVELQPGDRTYEKLKRSIEEFGYVEPIIINKVTGNVVGGHQRLTVLEDIGVTEVDCVIIEVDEVKEKQLNLALNKVSGEWDRDKLKDLFLDLEIEDDIDLSLTGFDDFEIDNIKLEFDHIEDLIDDDFISTEKEGDCVWSLVITGPYKNLKPTYSKPMDKCNWVMSQNQSAFSRKNDFRTLQIGKKIYVGYR